MMIVNGRPWTHIVPSPRTRWPFSFGRWSLPFRRRRRGAVIVKTTDGSCCCGLGACGECCAAVTGVPSTLWVEFAGTTVGGDIFGPYFTPCAPMCYPQGATFTAIELKLGRTFTGPGGPVHFPCMWTSSAWLTDGDGNFVWPRIALSCSHGADVVGGVANVWGISSCFYPDDAGILGSPWITDIVQGPNSTFPNDTLIPCRGPYFNSGIHYNRFPWYYLDNAESEDSDCVGIITPSIFDPPMV